MAGDGEVFETTADGILTWARTTQPEPPREAVLAHVRGLQRDGLIDAGEITALREAGYDASG